MTVNRGPIAQRLEHLSHKEQVAGSNPAGSTHEREILMESFDYTESMAIEDAIRAEYDIKETFETSPVDFNTCANMGFSTFSWSKPVKNPHDIVEVATGHRIALMLTTIARCEKKGWDWDIDEYRLEVTSRAMDQDEHDDYIRSLPSPSKFW